MMMKDVYSVFNGYPLLLYVKATVPPIQLSMDDDEIVRLLQDAQVARSASQVWRLRGLKSLQKQLLHMR
jgi:hypothetical protein